MTLLPEIRDAAWSPALHAFALVGGEALGFALADGCVLWPVALALLAHAALAAWAWRVRGALLPLAAAAGVVLAWRAEAAHRELLDGARVCAPDGRAPAYELRVEGAPRETRGKGRRMVDFPSHVGGVAVKAVLPLANGVPPPAEGEIWRCRGWLSPPRGNKSRYATHALWVTDAADAERLRAACESGPAGWYARAAARLARGTSVGLGWCPDLAALLQAMVWGRRADVPPAQRAAFAAAGTIHVFAISGLHVMLVMTILSICTVCVPGPSEAARQALAIPLAAAYVFLTGARPSAVRALAMGSICLAAPLFGRRPNALVAWGLTAFAAYALSPVLVFDVGCTLSFAVMFGIVLWTRRAGALPSPFAAVLADRCSRQASAVDAHGAGVIRKWVGFAQFVLGGFGVSFAAWLAGTPVAARVFARFTVGGLAANVAVVPLAGAAVALGFVGAFAGACGLSAAACLFNNAAAQCTGAMASVSESVAAWPGASLVVEPWGVGACAAWYAVLVAAYLCGSEACRSWLRRKFATRRKHA